MKIFIVYEIDLDNDCLKKSYIDILAAFDDREEAERFRESERQERKEGGYSGDFRCANIAIQELELNSTLT